MVPTALSYTEVVTTVAPATPEELASALGAANRDGQRVHFSLERMNRVLKYTPDDLTISVEAGITLGAINRLLGEHQQWLPIGAPRPDRQPLMMLAKKPI